MSRKAAVTSPEDRAIARRAADTFGGKPSVWEFAHDSMPLTIDILSCADSPGAGFTSYSTLGLSDHPMVNAQGEFLSRVEFAATMESAAAGFHRVLGSAAFRVMQTHEVVRPGRVFLDYVAEYFPDTHLPHLYFTAPFFWGDALSSAVFGDKRVSWLLAIPVSDAEVQYVRDHGDDAFEQLLESRGADVMSLSRASVV